MCVYTNESLINAARELFPLYKVPRSQKPYPNSEKVTPLYHRKLACPQLLLPSIALSASTYRYRWVGFKKMEHDGHIIGSQYLSSLPLWPPPLFSPPPPPPPSLGPPLPFTPPPSGLLSPSLGPPLLLSLPFKK